MFARFLCLAVIVFPAMAFTGETDQDRTMFPDVSAYVKARTGEYDQITPERRALLEKLSQYISQCRKDGKPIKLNFICTHNSRRSHLSQIWASIAANHYGMEGVETYSGGTEGTAFNPRAIATLKRAGLQIEVAEEGKNPRYAVRFGETDSPMICFSKAYGDKPNPEENFCAILVCSDADKKCPIVAGADARIALPFEDPKVSDGTPLEAETYDERCAQISREMLFVFSKIER
jgi:arsenate reductase